MNTRNSDDDLRDFMPDMAAIRREADPAYAEKKLKEALNNPELDRALAEVRALKAEESTMAAIGIRAPASPSGAAPLRKAAPGAPARRTKRLPAWVVYTLAVLAALLPAVLVFFLVKREPPAAQVAGSEGSEPASANAAPTSAAPFSAVSPGEDAGADASGGAPDAIDPMVGTPMPSLPAPGEPKGPGSGRPKPPVSASPMTAPVDENEFMPRKGPGSGRPKPPASASLMTAPVDENEFMPRKGPGSGRPKPPASASPRTTPVEE